MTLKFVTVITAAITQYSIKRPASITSFGHNSPKFNFENKNTISINRRRSATFSAERRP